MKKNIIIYIFISVVLAGCDKSGENNSKETEVQASENVVAKLSVQQYKSAEIILGTFSEAEMDEEIKSNGLVDVPPQNLASVSAPMAGYVRETSILPGMHIHKGEALAVLEHQDYIQLQQDYLQALSRLEMVDKEYVRQKELYDENVSSTKKLQISSSEYKSTKALVRSLEEKIKLLGINMIKLKEGEITPRITIRSPINGNVRSVNVSLGKFVNPTDVMYEIVDNSHLHLELRVFEKDILKVQTGQKILFTVPTVSNETFTGYVYLVGKTFDNATRTVLVHGHMDAEDKEKLIPGMYVNAVIITKRKKVNTLPDDALVFANNKYYIFIKTLEKDSSIYFKKTEVNIGVKKNNITEVLTGDSLKAQKNIVLNGSYFINSEMNKSE